MPPVQPHGGQAGARFSLIKASVSARNPSPHRPRACTVYRIGQSMAKASLEAQSAVIVSTLVRWNPSRGGNRLCSSSPFVTLAASAVDPLKGQDT